MAVERVLLWGPDWAPWEPPTAAENQVGQAAAIYTVAAIMLLAGFIVKEKGSSYGTGSLGAIFALVDTAIAPDRIWILDYCCESYAPLVYLFI